MKEAIRRIHLYSALAITSYLVLYFFTGFVLVHGDIFPNHDPEKATVSENLNFTGEDTPEAWTAFIQQKYAVRGQRQPMRKLKDGSLRINFFRPGHSFEALVSPDRQSVQITRTTGFFRQLMVGFHRVHVYGSGPLYDFWCFMYDVASASCILFAASGILIWYTAKQRDPWGWLFVVSGFGLTLMLSLYFMYMP